MKMSVQQKLMKIQSELKAPKNQYNSFGKYHYRSCEDILEGVKPLLKEQGCVLRLSDDVVEVGGRVYVRATATIIDAETGDFEVASAYAREAEVRKGMDESQVTGTASSYARKYALNGLFCIDDTKDADTNEYASKPAKEYKCSDCGKPFAAFTDKNGKAWSAGQVYHMSESSNTDGKARCSGCMAKAGTAKKKEG